MNIYYVIEIDEFDIFMIIKKVKGNVEKGILWEKLNGGCIGYLKYYKNYKIAKKIANKIAKENIKKLKENICELKNFIRKK